MIDDRTAPPLPGATRDEPSVTADWTVVQDLIDGVTLHEVRNVLRDSGHVTEILRQDWFPRAIDIDQVFQVALQPGGVSAWHVHLRTTDRLACAVGQVKIVLFDGREGSLTRGRINEFRLGLQRPGLVIVPAGVWHGLRNLAPDPTFVLNLVDRAYEYEAPDHWRLPPDTPEIPYAI
jgi:dTDP-4-dehydrorhamnose 3,5-epimerase